MSYDDMSGRHARYREQNDRRQGFILGVICTLAVVILVGIAITGGAILLHHH